MFRPSTLNQKKCKISTGSEGIDNALSPDIPLFPLTKQFTAEHRKWRKRCIAFIQKNNKYFTNVSEHIPMQEIPSRISEIPKDTPVGFLCHTGSRSGRVTMFLMQYGFTNIVNIAGGIERWSLEADPSVPRYRKAFGRAQVI